MKYFLWVKVIDCAACGKDLDLFPGYLVAEDSRHPKSVLVCPACGDLNEAEDRSTPGVCRSCDAALLTEGPAGRGRCVCAHCGHENEYPHAAEGPLRHRLFAIEYYNPHRKAQHKGRFFKKPDAKDLARIAETEQRWRRTRARFVPDQEILSGDETDRLHRWGYSHYRQMFSARQLVGLELSCRLIAGVKDERLRHALATKGAVEAAETIAAAMADEEELWLGRARFEADFARELEGLEESGFLIRSANRLSIGFRHQTVFDFLRARGFLRTRRSLEEYVIEPPG